MVNNEIPTATDTFKLSAKPYIGIYKKLSANEIASSDNPSLSTPNIRANGLSIGRVSGV